MADDRERDDRPPIFGLPERNFSAIAYQVALDLSGETRTNEHPQDVLSAVKEGFDAIIADNLNRYVRPRILNGNFTVWREYRKFYDDLLAAARVILGRDG